MEVVQSLQHVAVLGFPFSSHAAALLNLTRRIASEAPQVTFSFFSTSKSNASIFSGVNKEELHNLKHYDVDDGLPIGYVASGSSSGHTPVDVEIDLFMKAAPGSYRRAMDEAVAETGKKITCFLFDSFLWFGAEMAEEMHAKWVPFWIGGLLSFLAHLFTDLIRQRVGCGDVCDDQYVDFLPGLSAVKVSDLPEGIVTDTEQPVAIILHKMAPMLTRATAVAINSFVEVNPPNVEELKLTFQILNIGPLTMRLPQSIIMDEYGCLKWLNKHEKASVVYVTFGSMLIPPTHELIALAEALEESSFPFIWSFRGNHEKQLPQGFLERTRTKGMVVPWAPQTEILKHDAVGVCVTHCGWNSTLDCIFGGVPMIHRPYFADQKLNSRFVESVWGIGVGLENGVFTKKATLKVLKSVMTSDKQKIFRQKIVQLKKSAMQAVEPNGTSTRDLRALIQIITT